VPEGHTLCDSCGREVEHREVPAHKPINQILAEYFDIDLDKIEAEKRQMLDALRAKAS
jgi:hypothetical protein